MTFPHIYIETHFSQYPKLPTLTLLILHQNSKTSKTSDNRYTHPQPAVHEQLAAAVAAAVQHLSPYSTDPCALLPRLLCSTTTTTTSSSKPKTFLRLPTSYLLLQLSLSPWPRFHFLFDDRMVWFANRRWVPTPIRKGDTAARGAFQDRNSNPPTRVRENDKKLKPGERSANQSLQQHHRRRRGGRGGRGTSDQQQQRRSWQTSTLADATLPSFDSPPSPVPRPPPRRVASRPRGDPSPMLESLPSPPRPPPALSKFPTEHTTLPLSSTYVHTEIDTNGYVHVRMGNTNMPRRRSISCTVVSRRSCQVGTITNVAQSDGTVCGPQKHALFDNHKFSLLFNPLQEILEKKNNSEKKW